MLQHHTLAGFKPFFVARNFRILHPIIEDAESRQIWHFATMPGVEHCNNNYDVGCSGTPYCYVHFQAIVFLARSPWSAPWFSGREDTVQQTRQKSRLVGQ
jgi:hypothetical protein